MAGFGSTKTATFNTATEILESFPATEELTQSLTKDTKQTSEATARYPTGAPAN
jgi:hypothetical protein